MESLRVRNPSPSSNSLQHGPRSPASSEVGTVTLNSGVPTNAVLCGEEEYDVVDIVLGSVVVQNVETVCTITPVSLTSGDWKRLDSRKKRTAKLKRKRLVGVHCGKAVLYDKADAAPARQLHKAGRMFETLRQIQCGRLPNGCAGLMEENRRLRRGSNLPNYNEECSAFGRVGPTVRPSKKTKRGNTRPQQAAKTPRRIQIAADRFATAVDPNGYLMSLTLTRSIRRSWSAQVRTSTNPVVERFIGACVQMSLFRANTDLLNPGPVDPLFRRTCDLIGVFVPGLNEAKCRSLISNPFFKQCYHDADHLESLAPNSFIPEQQWRKWDRARVIAWVDFVKEYSRGGVLTWAEKHRKAVNLILEKHGVRADLRGCFVASQPREDPYAKFQETAMLNGMRCRDGKMPLPMSQCGLPGADHVVCSSQIHYAVCSITDAPGVWVNAANSQLRCGSGVDAAIHAACGPELAKFLSECGTLPIGTCLRSPSFQAPCRDVLHVVAPHGSDPTCKEDLTRAYECALKTAERNGMISVSFPILGTGAFGCDMFESIQVGLNVAVGYTAESEMHVTFVTPEYRPEFPMAFMTLQSAQGEEYSSEICFRPRGRNYVPYGQAPPEPVCHDDGDDEADEDIEPDRSPSPLEEGTLADLFGLEVEGDMQAPVPQDPDEHTDDAKSVMSEPLLMSGDEVIVPERVPSEPLINFRDASDHEHEPSSSDSEPSDAESGGGSEPPPHPTRPSTPVDGGRVQCPDGYWDYTDLRIPIMYTGDHPGLRDVVFDPKKHVCVMTPMCIPAFYCKGEQPRQCWDCGVTFTGRGAVCCCYLHSPAFFKRMKQRWRGWRSNELYHYCSLCEVHHYGHEMLKEWDGTELHEAPKPTWTEWWRGPKLEAWQSEEPPSTTENVLSGIVLTEHESAEFVDAVYPGSAVAWHKTIEVTSTEEHRLVPFRHTKAIESNVQIGCVSFKRSWLRSLAKMNFMQAGYDYDHEYHELYSPHIVSTLVADNRRGANVINLTQQAQLLPQLPIPDKIAAEVISGSVAVAGFLLSRNFPRAAGSTAYAEHFAMQVHGPMRSVIAVRTGNYRPTPYPVKEEQIPRPREQVTDPADTCGMNMISPVNGGPSEEMEVVAGPGRRPTLHGPRQAPESFVPPGSTALKVHSSGEPGRPDRPLISRSLQRLPTREERHLAVVEDMASHTTSCAQKSPRTVNGPGLPPETAPTSKKLRVRHIGPHANSSMVADRLTDLPPRSAQNESSSDFAAAPASHQIGASTSPPSHSGMYQDSSQYQQTDVTRGHRRRAWRSGYTATQHSGNNHRPRRGKRRSSSS